MPLAASSLITVRLSAPELVLIYILAMIGVVTVFSVITWMIFLWSPRGPYSERGRAAREKSDRECAGNCLRDR